VSRSKKNDRGEVGQGIRKKEASRPGENGGGEDQDPFFNDVKGGESAIGCFGGVFKGGTGAQGGAESRERRGRANFREREAYVTACEWKRI